MPPLSGSDEWNENEMSNFELNDSKKQKLSDSSLHRVTPDSGIALHYQSSVSSVGSLSPPIEKASSGDDKGFQGFDESSDNEKRPRHMSELGSDVANLSIKKATTGDISQYTSNNSPTTPSPSFQKGTIPLSHAPPMDIRAHQQPLMHVHTAQMPGVSPGLIHSSQMVHSPAHNTAFPFNPSNQMGHPFHHQSPSSHSTSIYHPAYTMGPGSHSSVFSHSPHHFNPPPRTVPPYASGPGIYPHTSIPIPQNFRHHYPPQHSAMPRNFHNSSLMRSDSLNSSNNSINNNTDNFNLQGNSIESTASLSISNTTSLPPANMADQSPAMTMEIETTTGEADDMKEFQDQPQTDEERQQLTEETKETAEVVEEDAQKETTNEKSRPATEKNHTEKEQTYSKRYV